MHSEAPKAFVPQLHTAFFTDTIDADANESLFSRTDGQTPNTWLSLEMPSDAYHANRDILSSSLLKALLVSPAHFQSTISTYRPATVNMDFGTLVHALVLEPSKVGQFVRVYPGVKNRTKEYREFEDRHAGHLVVDEPTLARAIELSDKIKERKVRGRPFYKFIEEGHAEPSIFFVEPTSGLPMKIRLDLMHPDISFDLKTTRHARVDGFVRDSVDLHYDLSAYMYSLGRCLYEGSANPKPFVFVAASTDEHSSPIHVLDVGESFLTNGCKKFQEAASIFHACSTTNLWPDNSTNGSLEIAHWQEFKADRAWSFASSI